MAAGGAVVLIYLFQGATVFQRDCICNKFLVWDPFTLLQLHGGGIRLSGSTSKLLNSIDIIIRHQTRDCPCGYSGKSSTFHTARSLWIGRLVDRPKSFTQSRSMGIRIRLFASPRSSGRVDSGRPLTPRRPFKSLTWKRL